MQWFKCLKSWKSRTKRFIQIIRISARNTSQIAGKGAKVCPRVVLIPCVYFLARLNKIPNFPHYDRSYVIIPRLFRFVASSYVTSPFCVTMHCPSVVEGSVPEVEPGRLWRDNNSTLSHRSHMDCRPNCVQQVGKHMDYSYRESPIRNIVTGPYLAGGGGQGAALPPVIVEKGPFFLMSNHHHQQGALLNLGLPPPPNNFSAMSKCVYIIGWWIFIARSHNPQPTNHGRDRTAV